MAYKFTDSTDFVAQLSVNDRRIRGDNKEWSVYEMPANTEHRREPPSLIFSSRSVVRRVRHFPAHWRNLDDAALYELSKSR